jgi:hypothetical protein
LMHTNADNPQEHQLSEHSDRSPDITGDLDESELAVGQVTMHTLGTNRSHNTHSRSAARDHSEGRQGRAASGLDLRMGTTPYNDPSKRKGLHYEPTDLIICALSDSDELLAQNHPRDDTNIHPREETARGEGTDITSKTLASNARPELRHTLSTKAASCTENQMRHQDANTLQKSPTSNQSDRSPDITGDLDEPDMAGDNGAEQVGPNNPRHIAHRTSTDSDHSARKRGKAATSSQTSKGIKQPDGLRLATGTRPVLANSIIHALPNLEAEMLTTNPDNITARYQLRDTADRQRSEAWLHQARTTNKGDESEIESDSASDHETNRDRKRRAPPRRMHLDTPSWSRTSMTADEWRTTQSLIEYERDLKITRQREREERARRTLASRSRDQKKGANPNPEEARMTDRTMGTDGNRWRSEHRTLLFRANTALRRQMAPNESDPDTRPKLCQKFQNEAHDSYFNSDPEEWRTIPTLQFNLRDVLMGKLNFPSKAVRRSSRHFQQAPPHVIEFLRCVAANPIAMATQWGQKPIDTSMLSEEDKKEFDNRVQCLRSMPIHPPLPTEWEEDTAILTEEQKTRERHESDWLTYTEFRARDLLHDDELPEEEQGWQHTYDEPDIDLPDYMEDHIAQVEDICYSSPTANDAPQVEDDNDPDSSFIMVPTDNDYINSQEDPTEAHIMYILSMVISRRDRFEILKRATNGSQARRLMNSEAANKKRKKKASAQSKKKAKIQRNKEFQIWVEGLPTIRSTYINPTTTAAMFLAQVCPQMPPEAVTLRVKGRTWPPKATASNIGIQTLDRILVIGRGLGGMDTTTHTMEEADEEEERPRSPQWSDVAPKKQRLHKSAKQSKLIFTSPPRASQEAPVLATDPTPQEAFDHTQLDDDETEGPPENSAVKTDASMQTRSNYKNDPFTRPFFYKQIPAQRLTVQQRQDLYAHMLGQAQQIVDLVLEASTIQVGPMVMSQIPDAINCLKKMGYPINIQSTMEKMSSNYQQMYVHNFDRKKPERCTITVELSRRAEFSILPPDDTALPIWRQLIMPVNPGENSYIKIQPCHRPEELTYPLCTFYDIHTGILQLDMIQHCYLILKQCLSPQHMDQVLIEFRMGSIPNPTYDPRDAKTRRRITTTFGIVKMSRPENETSTAPLDWIIPIQSCIKTRTTSKGPQSRTSILQGPYSIGITLGRYQDIPPTFYTLDKSITSDPMISLLHVYPKFSHTRLGEAINHICKLLRSSNLILSIHVREDWIHTEDTQTSRLSIAFTMTGPPMSEAVRSIMQSDIQAMLDNPRVLIVLPNSSPRPLPWNRVQELATSTAEHEIGSKNATTTKNWPRPNAESITSAPRPPAPNPWASRAQDNPGPLATQTYDISGIIGLPETIQRLNLRMDNIETQAATSQSKLETQLATMASALHAISQSVQSLVAASAPRDGNP